ncbi:MAG: hypothetical protein P4L43_03155 [Syntrophobacteraceae bacterium]|nr:hypothetical protein [Syntrophobacteraceae bacterium]
MFFGQTVHTFCLSNRDEAGAQALSELRVIGINLVADALAGSVDHKPLKTCYMAKIYTTPSSMPAGPNTRQY